MKNITKNFVEIDLADMEGKRSDWTVVDMTYEEAVARLKDDPFINAVRIVEKTFNPDTFKITNKVIRMMDKMIHFDFDKKEYITTYKEV